MYETIMSSVAFLDLEMTRPASNAQYKWVAVLVDGTRMLHVHATQSPNVAESDAVVAILASVVKVHQTVSPLS